MEFVRPGTLIEFMRYRRPVLGASLTVLVISLVALFVPGPNFGIDFAGGTEVQLTFRGDVESSRIRTTLQELGYDRPDVVAVEGSTRQYIIRVREVSSLPEEQEQAALAALRAALGDGVVSDMTVSPGGDKVSLRLREEADPATIEAALVSAGVAVREVLPLASASADKRYEAHLVGLGDELVGQLGERFGELAPDGADRIEWVGPKAGEQLRDAAVQALLYAVAFIMVYIAFRFDLRFAPGAVLAMAHDVVITMGVYVLLRKEVNLTTVAALLTVLGYSINDTIVVFDRIRENMGRMRDRSLLDLINISTSQTLSRTLITGGTTMLSIGAFFFWGTPVIQDITFALFIGILIGTFSSIFIAAPITEWIDRKYFRKAAA